MLWHVIAAAAVVCSSAGLLPQVMKSFRTKQTADLSYGMIFTILAGSVLWFMHGIKNGDWAIITTNVFVFAAAMSLFVMKQMFDQR